jgi:hypothetical protein
MAPWLRSSLICRAWRCSPVSGCGDQRHQRHRDDQHQPYQSIHAAGADGPGTAQKPRWVAFQVPVDAAFGLLLVGCQVFAQQVDGCLALAGMQKVADCGITFITCNYFTAYM